MTSDPVESALAGRTVVLGVSGGIAAYKAVELTRRMVDAGATVLPVLTDGAQRFVGEVTFSALASEPARTELFGGDDPIPHTRLARRAEAILVAPATATVLAKAASGIADDLLTATLLASTAPVVVAPAMHAEMWEHPATAANVTTLAERGVRVVPPATGRLAGGDEGPGRLADLEEIEAALADALAGSGPLAGRRVVVTAGGTREPIDPVRFVGNRSSGRMGHALAAAARARGATTTLITASDRPVPRGVAAVAVETAEEMCTAVLDRFDDADVLVMAAAVADFRPKLATAQKLKKEAGTPEVILEPTPDVLAACRDRRERQLLVGFAAETEDVEAHAREKLGRKDLDLIVANDVGATDSGFEVDTNRAFLIDSSGRSEPLGLLSKHDLAGLVLDRVVTLLEESS